MNQQVPVSPDTLLKPEDGFAEHVRDTVPGVSPRRLGIVNVVFLGEPDAPDRGWVLVDAGVAGTAGLIRRAAQDRFGASRPGAIVLTHGHFDHVGEVRALAEEWEVDVYAHPLERPYLDGRASYPPPDPKVGGGLMSLASPLYPRGPIDLGRRLSNLPQDGRVPCLPDWRWIHTPGHSVGHVSLWREGDRTLVAGDAVITTRQESAYAVLAQTPELHGPPMYYTADWAAAEDSAKLLALLEPETLVSGHGPALQGSEMREALQFLAERFTEIAVPERGTYVENPASAADGSAYR